MTAKRSDAQITFWQRNRLKLLAVAAVALLAWLAYYLERVPIARKFGPEDAKLAFIAEDQAVRFGGVPAGRLGSLRTISAKRLTLNFPASAIMRSPELQPFKAKAAAEAATLAGLSCGADRIMIDAHTVAGENATVALSLQDVEPTSREDVGLLIGKADPVRYQNGLVLRADRAKLLLRVDLNRSGEGPHAGQMTLCRSGVTASLGHAEFELPPGETMTVEFLEPGPSADAPAAFDFEQSLPVSSLAFARFEEGEPFDPERITCGAAKAGRVLWRRIIPAVKLSDCRPKSLAVTGLDLTSGKLEVSKRPAYFENFQPAKDSAHFVSTALSNPVVQQLLVGGLLSGLIIPWAIGQFRKKRRAPSRSGSRAQRSEKK